MKYALQLRVGPVNFRIGSAWRAPIEQLRQLYAGYAAPEGDVAEFTVRLEPARPWRRMIKPSVAIRGDFTLPDAAPLPLAHALLAAEMGMNLQMALGQRRFLLLHASAVARGGEALLMTGSSGAGKSTLAALLGERGWRLLGDEFALLDLDSRLLHPFPRAVSLKNTAIALLEREVPQNRFGPLLKNTPKGMIRHMRPQADAISRMAEPARPALILFPRFGHATAQRQVGAAEAFVRFTQASTNYVALGEPGFHALTRLISDVPLQAIDYPDTQSAVALVEALWRARR
jgi:HprK-related kinase A